MTTGILDGRVLTSIGVHRTHTASGTEEHRSPRAVIAAPVYED